MLNDRQLSFIYAALIRIEAVKSSTFPQNGFD